MPIAPTGQCAKACLAPNTNPQPSFSILRRPGFGTAFRVSGDTEKENVLIGSTQLPDKLVFVEYMLSLRASAHTGVAIPRLKGTR